MASAVLRPSKLGTKEHWEDVYARELENFEEFGDEGEVWFGEDSVEKMVDWCLSNVPPSSRPNCLDIGTGNGSLLFALVEAGYYPSTLQGIDYSPNSIALARVIASKRDPNLSISFQTFNFIENSYPPPHPDLGEGSLWDLLLDKGTYDAIALADQTLEGEPLKLYPARVSKALKKGGFILITSCNFTEDELKQAFASSELGLSFHSRVEYATFIFGGQKGSTISTVAFQRD